MDELGVLIEEMAAAWIKIGQALIALGNKFQKECENVFQPLSKAADPFCGSEVVTQPKTQNKEKLFVPRISNDKTIPKDKAVMFEINGKYSKSLRACKEGKKYFVVIRDACLLMGLHSAVASKIYYELQPEYRAKARIKINGQIRMVNVALQRPLLSLCEHMGYDISNLKKYFNRGGRNLVVANVVKN